MILPHLAPWFDAVYRRSHRPRYMETACRSADLAVGGIQYRRMRQALSATLQDRRGRRCGGGGFGCGDRPGRMRGLVGAAGAEIGELARA